MKNINNKGYTLIEMLVVLAIFSTFVIIAADLFLTVNRVQRETQVSERVLSESRFILETIARDVRAGLIDYKEFGNPADPADAIVNPSDELIYINSVSERVRIKKNTNFCPSSESMPCVTISRNNGATWASMTPLGIKVIDLKFIIQPDQDPFYFNGLNWLSDKQPMITVILTLGSTDEISQKYFEITTQTTISVRGYGR
ncbi:MAG: prepilin-type N-terminal cleavage/methylation domain-containing protein [bacterium]